MKYFLQRDGRTYGPYSYDDLKRYQAENRIGPNDMIRRDDSQQWEPWQQVLNAAAAPAAPQFTPPTPAAPQAGGFGAPSSMPAPTPMGAPQQDFGSTPPAFGGGQPGGGFGQQPPAFGGGGFGQPQGDQGFGGGFGAPQGQDFGGGFGGGQAGFGGAPQQPGFGGGTVGPMPPDMQWWLVLIIGSICGLFALFWIFKQVTFVKKIDPQCQAPKFYIMGFVLLIAGYIVTILGAVMAGVMGDIGAILPILGLVVILGGAACMILASFKMRESIHNYYTMVEPMGINLMDTTGAVLTFFFPIYYFQYHFANIAAQKKAMGHPAV